MSKFSYKGCPVKANSAKIESVDEHNGRYELELVDPKYHWRRHYYLPKNLTRRAPQAGETLTSYEYCSEVVGCDFNGEEQFRAQGFKEA